MSSKPPEPSIQQITFFYERWRAMALGVLETATTTFLLLIAVRYYQTGPFPKALLAGSPQLGLLVSPLLVYAASRARLRPSLVGAVTCVLGAFAYVTAACFPSLPVFLAGSVAGACAATMIIPLTTQITSDNYPSSRRGSLFARTLMLRIMVAAVFADLAGRLLTDNFDRFPALLAIYGLAMLAAAFFLSRVPSQPMGNHGDAHLLEGFRLYRRDRRFRRILAAWGLMGFANLMMLSLRVEYLANPRYGFMLTAVSVALVTTVLPNVARILMNPVWGRLFDRADFFSLRVVINLCFALSIACFFSGLGWTALVLGALLFGVASSGGEIAWSLWVTKFAAPSKVADYMAVHTFLTGVRGVIAPFLAFYALRILAPETLAFAAGALILWSCILLHRERRRPDKRPHAQPLTEEVVE